MAMTQEWQALYLKDFLDVSDLKENPPEERKFIRYTHKGIEEYSDQQPEYGNVPNCFSRYNYPKYKQLYYQCKSKVEEIMGEKLYPTYFYDRFYFDGSYLKPHIDRPSCEISVSLNMSSNLKNNWPLFFEINKELHAVNTNPGDAILYKGMDIPHWRQTLVADDEEYYHQVFFHFVRADGHFLEYAFDRL